MAQSDQFHEAWAQVRDYARPVLPDDVYFLDEARADAPPSRAHVKRLQRVRPEITAAQPRVALDYTRQQQINQAVSAGARIAALVGYVKPIYR